MAAPETSVIIPAHNRVGQTIALIESLYRMDYTDFEIILIDDASTDGLSERVRELFPDVQVICHKERLGAAAARNTGIKASTGRYLCFVDNDNIVDASFLGNMVKAAAGSKDIGCVAPKMYYLSDPKRLYFAGARFNMTTSMTRHNGQGQIDNGAYDRTVDVDFVPNAYLAKREVIDKIGSVDTYFEMFYEDADWFYRVKNAGYRIVINPAAVTFHDILWKGESPSIRSITGCDTKRRAFLMARNRTVFMRRYSGKAQFAIYSLFFLPILTCGYSAIYIRFGRFDYAVAAFRGMGRGIIDAFGLT